jgi:hypothetical protein
MSYRLSALLLSAALIACTAEAPPAEDIAAPDASATSEPSVPTLTEGWVLTGLDAPESVIETPDGTAYFVSLVGGDSTAKDNNGAIALISKDGEVINPNWVTGTDAVPLHAPKGMTIVENEKGVTLLVTDIDHVAFILADEGRLAKRLPAPGASFLNDVAKGPGASAFISDSRNARIYKLENDAITVWLEDERLAGVNGLQMDGDALLVSTMVAGELLSVDLSTKAITGLATGMVNADGIGVRADGSYMLSSYTGQLWHVRPGEMPTLMLDMGVDAVGEANLVSMNDVLFLDDTVIAPNWRPGSVRTYMIQ